MVDDPSEYVDELLSDPKKHRTAKRPLTQQQQESGQDKDSDLTLASVAADLERQRLFDLIKKIVVWKNTTNASVLDEARREIWISWKRACAANVDHPQAEAVYNSDRLPVFLDPFSGGGA